MFKDLRHAVRLLWQSKGWTTVVVLSLALGIGANTAILSAVNARLLTSLPVQKPEELVRFRYAGRNDMVTSSSGYGFLSKTADGKDVRASFSYPMYQQFVADNRSMTDLMACAPFGRVNVFVDGQSEIAEAFISSGNYYQLLGVTARVGRTILPEDDRPTAPPVAVISSKYWHSRFGTDPAVVGKAIKVNNVPVTIVGVIAPTFSGVQQPVANPPDISLPLAGSEPGTTSVRDRLYERDLLSGSVNSTGIFVHGRAYAPDVRDRDNNINRLVVSPNFFDVMGIPVLAGRGFSERDSDTAPKVVMINQAAATNYFPNENPIGQRMGGRRRDSRLHPRPTSLEGGSDGRTAIRVSPGSPPITGRGLRGSPPITGRGLRGSPPITGRGLRGSPPITGRGLRGSTPTHGTRIGAGQHQHRQEVSEVVVGSTGDVVRSPSCTGDANRGPFRACS
jgi:hypothetical protein